jgi:hypothetical protein
MRKRAGLLPFKEFLVTKSMMVRGLAALCAVAVFSCLPALAQSAVARRVTQKIDETKLTTLKGHVRPFLKAAIDKGPVDDNQPLGAIMLMFSRTPQQQADLDALVDQLHSKSSANYHNWLTPQQFGARFEPADEDVAAVKAWLQSKGFTILDVVPSKTHISFTGTVGQLRTAFHVDIHHVSLNNEEHMAAIDEPSVPAALAPVIGGLHKLDDFSPKPLVRPFGAFNKDLRTGKITPVEGTTTGPTANFDSGTGNYSLGPQDFYTVYNENPLLTAGITGAGQTIAVIEEVQVATADVTTFRAQFGLPTYPATPNATGGGVNYMIGSSTGLGGYTSCYAPVTQSAGKTSTEEAEADIDLQWAGTTAPNAIVDFVACGGTATSGDGTTVGSLGIDHSAQYIVNYLSSTVVAASLSYGECEGDLTNSTTTGVGYYNNQWEQYAAEGITAIVSSGDGGAEQCYQDDTHATTLAPSVNGWGSSAYNVSAGGTDFGDLYESNDYTTSPVGTWWNATNGTGDSSAVTYIPETTWAGYCSGELFASLLQKEGNTTFGTTYTPSAICSHSTGRTLGGYLAVVGGAGGISTYNTIPTWQSVYGVGLNSVSSTFRNLPDVSLFASNGWWGHYLPYCESDVDACTLTNYDAGDLGAGGTSFVAPQLAGLMALISQKTGDRQGQADYTLYNLAAQQYGTPGSPSANLTACSGSGVATGQRPPSSCYFYDISNDMPSLQSGTITPGIYQPCLATDIDCYKGSGTTYGVNVVPGTTATSGILGYTASPGYDDATGLGSLNFYGLVEGWNSVSPAFASTTTLTASASSVVYSTTANLTLTATVKATGRGGAVAPAGTVEFFDGGSITGTLLGTGTIASNCTGTGASTSCDGVATLSLASDVLTPGSNSIVAYFEGDGANDAASTSSAVAVTVTSWPQTITFNNAATGTYGGTLTLSATASSGLTPVTFAITGGTGAAALNGGVLTFTGPGTIIITATQVGNGTYASTTAQQTITVGKAALTVNVANASMNYGAGFPTFTDTSITGLVNGDTVGTTITVTYSSTTPANSNAGAYTGAITATVAGTHSGDYTVTVNKGTLTINKVGLTVNVASASMNYGAGFPAFTDTSITGLVNGDTVGTTLTVTYSSTTPATSNVGTYAGAITATVSGTSSGNYTVTVNKGTLTINKVGLTVTVNPASMTYGGGFPTFTSSLATLVNGDTVGGTITITYSSTTPANSNVGTYTGAITATVGGTSSGNYTVTVNKGTLTINKATLTVTVNPASMTYGGSFPTFSGTLATLVNGDTVGTTITVTYSSTTPANSNAGTYTGAITAAVGGTAIGNYTVTVNKGTLTINKAALTVTVNPASFTYGGSFPTFSGSLATLVNGDTLGGTITVSYSSTTPANSNAGTYTGAITATVGGTSAGNYTVTVNAGTLTIGKASLTVTVNPASMTYGGSFPAFSGTLATLVNGDTLGGTITVNYSSTTPASSNAGTYAGAITASVGGSSAGNYSVTVNAATLTIHKAALTITENPASGTYGVAPPAFSGTLATLVNGDTVGGTITVTYSSTASGSSPFSDVGGYPISAVVTGSSAGNYQVTDNGGTYTISPAPLTITVASVNDGYGNALPTFTSTLGGLTNGDTSTDGKHIVHPLAVKRHGNSAELGGVAGDLTVNYSTSASSTSPYSNVGTYPINATLVGAAAGDYTVTTVTPGTLTITAVPLAITENPATGVYGSAPPAFSGSLATLVNGDTVGGTINVAYSSTASNGSPFSDVGGYPISASVTGASAGNYTVIDTGSVYSITPAPLTIAVNSTTDVYGTPLPTFTSQLTGLVNGDSSSDAKHIVHPLVVKRHANSVAQLGGSANDLLIDYTTNANASSPYSDAGTYWINASLDSSGAYADYQVTSVTQGVLTINQAPQVITFGLFAYDQYANTTLPLVATSTSNLPVTFYSFTQSVCTVSESGGVWTLSLIGYGSCNMGANQVGNNDYLAAVPAGQTFFVHHASQTITFPGVADQVAGTTVTLAATASSGLAVSYTSTTPAYCSVSGSTVSSLAYGNCTIQANQAGNDVYSAAATVSQTFFVHHASQTISFPLIAYDQTAATTVTLSATASSGLTVTFSSLTPSICTVSGSTVALLSYGSCTVNADQAGNGEYSAAATASQTFFVHHASQTITFPLIPYNQTAATTVTLSATASSGLTVTFSSLTPSICTVSGSTVTLLGYGSCTVDADQAGNGEYSAAATASQTFFVHHASQTITFPAVGTQTAGSSVLLPATASSGLAVSYASTTPAVCTIDGTGLNAVLAAPGTCTIQASQAGNAAYSAATTVTQSFTVIAPPVS